MKQLPASPTDPELYQELPVRLASSTDPQISQFDDYMEAAVTYYMLKNDGNFYNNQINATTF